MRLWVAGYEKPPAPPPRTPLAETNEGLELTSTPGPDADAGVEEDFENLLVYRLPIIHVFGESGGNQEGWYRKIKGTVRMVGRSDVRWSLVSVGLLFFSVVFALFILEVYFTVHVLATTLHCSSYPSCHLCLEFVLFSFKFNQHIAGFNDALETYPPLFIHHYSLTPSFVVSR
jgi:hypothetical protein